MLSQACRGIKLVTSAKGARGQAGSRGSGSHPAAPRPGRLRGSNPDEAGKETWRSPRRWRRLVPSPDRWPSCFCACVGQNDQLVPPGQRGPGQPARGPARARVSPRCVPRWDTRLAETHPSGSGWRLNFS